ncbi:VCBS repeat-containing protein [uncultured Microscilla sp.]|uniref:FG-GAP repeat domain-containing protein n=1 Tax=uncultured Microscilla sp. TaxID=432653 RepID=UPI002632F9D7|nr:VCBS repeat-containing protein [uncultured Microscilla sp.]
MKILGTFFIIVTLWSRVGFSQNIAWQGFAPPQYYPFNICSPIANIPQANCPNRILTKDLDGDGDLDVILDAQLYQHQSSQGPKLAKASVFINQGKGTFGKEIIFEKPDQFAFISDVADFNQDGRPDMVVHHFWKNGFWLYKGKVPQDSAKFAFEPPRFFTTGSHGGETFLLDYDQDGNIDIASFSSGALEPLALHLFKGKGDGSFELPKKIQSTVGNISTYYQVLQADLNNDGLPDFLVTDKLAQVSFLQTTAGQFKATWRRSLFKMPYPVLHKTTAEDSTRAYVATRQQLKVLTADSLGSFKRVVQQSKLSVTIKQQSERFAVTDLNHDGTADVLGVEPRKKGFDRLFFALRNQAGQFYQPQYLPMLGKVDTKKFGYAIADLNGDGWHDVLAIVRGIDELAVWLNKGTQGNKPSPQFVLDKPRGKPQVLRKSAQANTYKYYQKKVLLDISSRPNTYNRSLFLYDQKMIPHRFFVDGKIYNLEIALHKKLNQAIMTAGASRLKIYLKNVPDSVLNETHRDWGNTIENMTLVYDQDPAKSLNTNFLPYTKHPNALIDFHLDNVFRFDPTQGKNLLMAVEYIQTKPTANGVDFQVFHNKGERQRAYHYYVRGNADQMSDQLTEMDGLRPMFTFNNNFDLRLTKLKTDIGQDLKADYNNIDLTLQNIRIREADFAQHPLKIYLKSVGSSAIAIQPIEIKKGKLGFFRDTTISFFIPAIKQGGAYQLRAYVASVDNFLANDTILSKVVVNKVSLPCQMQLNQVHSPSAQRLGWISKGTALSSLRQQRRYSIHSLVFLLQANNRNAYVKSPVFKVRSPADTLYFKAFATAPNAGKYRAMDTDDVLEVRVSADGGKTYQTIAAYNHQNIKATTPKLRKIPLKNYVGKSISVAFYGVGGVRYGKYELHLSEVRVGE